MAGYFEGVKFKYSFRDYQSEFLKNIGSYLSDKRIHVVAAPGAGKTILALEMCRMLGEKTLVIVPSIALKEQWVERITKDFSGTQSSGFVASDKDSLSSSAKNATVTVITYHMLHTMVKRGDNVAAFISARGIKTIVLDECHHMRRLWFISLKKVVSRLDDCRLISLTATPPYDNGAEFRNYMDLCGEIDERITIGQLVNSDCLCPHQDFLYLNAPSAEQEELMKKICDFSDSLMEDIKKNEQFIAAVALNDLIVFPERHIDDILKDFDFYVAMHSFLSCVGCSRNAEDRWINFTPPPFDKEKLALILERYIYGRIFEAEIIDGLLHKIKKLLELNGLVKDKHINLIYSNKLSKQILANSGKLDSICEIVKSEYDNLGDGLNMAICTDFIKDEFYGVGDEDELDELGVMSIFRKLRARCPEVELIVLTGSYIFIPAKYSGELRKIAASEYGISHDEIKIRDLGIDFAYSAVEITESRRRYAVNMLTKLFCIKGIQVLIGTIALIGEGWDAPFVNSLIIASSVSTYVTSNQVRGRAIRVRRSEPEKVSNIWHLVTLENNGSSYVQGKDYRSIADRFIGFEGINFESDVIETGIERLNAHTGSYSKNDIEEANRKSMALAADRQNTIAAWKRSLLEYTPEYYEHIYIKTFSKHYSAKLGFMRKLKVRRLTQRLAEALKSAGIVSRDARPKVYCSDRGGYRVALLNTNTREQMLFAGAVRQQFEFGINMRYAVSFLGKLYPVPDILGRRKDLAEIYRAALKLPFSKLIFIRNEAGKRLLLESKLNDIGR